MYKRVFLSTAIATSIIFTGCTPLKRAQTGMARAIAGSDVREVNGHEVYCSEGKVCSEIDVLSISAEDRDGGRVRVVLKNRTGNTALVKIGIEIRDRKTGEILAKSRPENVAIPPTEEKVYDMPGINKEHALLRVLMNAAI